MFHLCFYCSIRRRALPQPSCGGGQTRRSSTLGNLSCLLYAVAREFDDERSGNKVTVTVSYLGDEDEMEMLVGD
jgi:hypothetical protein